MWERAEGRVAAPRRLTDGYILQISGRDGELVLSIPGDMGGVINGLPDGFDGVVQASFEDDHRILWMGTTSGLYRLDRVTGEVLTQFVDPDPDAWLSNNITALLRDRAGATWVGTLSGLYVHDPQTKEFGHIGPGSGLPSRRGAHTVMSLHEDRDGTLWVGSLGEGLIRLDRGRTRLTSYRSRAGDPSSPADDLVWAIHEDALGRLWIGTHTGLCLFDRQRGTCERIDVPAHVVTSDPAGVVWVSGPGGLFRIAHGGTDLLQVRPAPGNEASAINALAFDRAGNLCLGQRDLQCFDTSDPNGYNPIVYIPDSLVAAHVWAIHCDDEGTYWLGTRRGLLRYDPGSKDVHSYYDNLEFTGSVVYSILEDERGRLWLGTSRGLISLDKQSGVFRHFDVQDGVANVEFNRRAASIGPGGQFYFGGLDGITSFDPERIVPNPNQPPIVITRLELFDEEGTHEVNIGRDRQIAIQSSAIAFSIEYAALAFTSPLKNRYRYRLVGFDDAWVEAGFRRRAEYTNLDPGTYVFHVIGSNEDGVWNDVGRKLEIRLLPHWWETLWFRLGALLLLAALLFAGYRVRVVQLLRMERMRLRIARDLHDDIGSRLSGLALISDMVGGGENLTSRQSAHLGRIGRGTREVIDSLRDIVWFVHPDNEHPGGLVSRMRETADELLNGIDWSFELEGKTPFANLDLAKRRHLYLVFKEALHNIARHSGASVVAIRLERRGGVLTMRVADNGRGFDQAQTTSGYGLRNIERRVEMVGGSVQVSSTPGAGTRLTVEVRIT